MEKLQSVMFTCMDITMAPGGHGGGRHILRTDLLSLAARIGGLLQRERFGSLSVNGVRTNLPSHNHAVERDQAEPANKDKQ